VAALTLAKNGVPVRVIEKSTTNRIGQRGAGILVYTFFQIIRVLLKSDIEILWQPRSFEVFESLGIIDEVMKRSIPIPLTRLYKLVDGIEVAVAEFELSPSHPSTPACPYVSIYMYIDFPLTHMAPK